LTSDLIFSQLGVAGRLGNQLWQIASTIGLAQSRGATPRFPSWEYEAFFSVPREYFVAPTALRGREAHELITSVQPRQRIYMQDYALFAQVQDRVRAYFAPSAEALERIEAVDWFYELPRPRLALHVRRGDLLSQHPVMTPLRSTQYYARAAALYPEDTIVVFSDDIAWCRRRLPRVLPGRRLFFYPGIPRPVARAAYRASPVLDWIDLQLMARCEHHVISSSTLAWWGAFLSADPSPVYPSNWYAPAIPWKSEAQLMMPSGWREVYDPTTWPPPWRHLRRLPFYKSMVRARGTIRAYRKRLGAWRRHFYLA
jgi:hypothetical protein